MARVVYSKAIRAYEREVLQREDGSRASARIVAVTALSDDYHRALGLEVGMDAWHTKPIKMATLRKDLQRWKKEWEEEKERNSNATSSAPASAATASAGTAAAAGADVPAAEASAKEAEAKAEPEKQNPAGSPGSTVTTGSGSSDATAAATPAAAPAPSGPAGQADRKAKLKERLEAAVKSPPAPTP